MRKFSFASVNMRRCNAAMHALLNDNEGEDVLFVQEPWFNPVGTARCDTMYQGKDVLGGAAHPKWRLAYPSFTNGQRAKVMTYVRIHDRSQLFKKNHCQMIVRNDLASHPCILISDFRVGSYYWRVLNFYNDVADPSALSSLLGLDLDATIPTLIIGDFNLHSTTWSPTGWVTSSSSHRLEEWMATQTFTLLNKPRIPTRMGEGGARNSTIDLAWSNMAAAMQGTFFGAEVNFGDSMGSDHALIRVIASTPAHVSRTPEDRTNRFNTDIDAEAWEEWNRIIRFELPPLLPILSPPDVDSRVCAIYHAFNEACKATMKSVGAAPGFNSRWWNDECKAAAAATKGGFWTDEEAREANRHLKRVVREAKRSWANDYITTANIWEVAAWRHGRRSSLIPALLDHDGRLVYDHEGMASLLSERFFTEEGTPIPPSFPDDPPPRPARPFLPFNEEEIMPLIKATSNKSAPGSSGIDWSLLKKGWDAVKDHLIDVYNACLVLGYHPPVWKEAKVVAIPKPDKPDYSLPKAHRPISLLETMSKLLEKAVAKRMQHDIVAHKLIHTNQFGGRAHSSCLDAGLTLLHDVQSAHRAGLKVGILLFDVRGFFDNVNHGRMAAILENSGYPPELVRWATAFLADRKVRLSFNNSVSEERGQPIGVPQGSPLSPVFSITYTSALLSMMRSWNNSSLGMYVDDGVLFACAQDWEEVERLLRARYTICEEWLRRSGLAIEPDKTELLFFQKPYERNSVAAPSRLLLPDPSRLTYYVVEPVENLRYLGFFINRRLKWEPHVRIMCNRARASLKALQVLGNSIRGLSMANWRLVLNAVCLPVLAYGSQIWFLSGASKTLVNMLQRVQNDMVKQVTGAFRTAPREALLHFTRMVPMRHYIEKLTYTSALRLYRLPRPSQLLRRLGQDWYAPGQGDLPLVVARSRALPGKRNQRPTALEALALKVPSSGPRVDLTVLAPWEVPNWAGHVSYMGVETPFTRKGWIRDLTAAVPDPSTMFIHVAAATCNREAEELGVVGGAAATYARGVNPLTWFSWVAGSELTQFDADAFALARMAETLASTYTDGVAPPLTIYIFNNSSPAMQAVKNPRSIKAHSFALRFHKALTSFFLSHRDVHVILCWAPKDDELEGSRLANHLAAGACRVDLADLPNGMDRVQSAAYQKDRARRNAFLNWEKDYWLDRARNNLQVDATGFPLDGAAYQYSISQPPSEKNHPLWSAATAMEKDERGRKTRRPLFSRRTTSTTLQLAVDHAFTGSYAKRFRPLDPPPTLRCPCGHPLRTPHHLIRDCRLFYLQRTGHKIITHGRTLSLKTLFSTTTQMAHRLLSFIADSCAAMRPPEIGRWVNIPPEPD
jgi:hypothetical protein